MGKENSIYPVRLVLYMSLAFLLKASSFQLSASTPAVKEHLERGVLSAAFLARCRIQLDHIPSIEYAEFREVLQK